MCEISIVELLLCAICPDTFGLASVKSRIIIKDSVSPAPGAGGFCNALWVR